MPNVSYKRALICTIKYICYEYFLTNNKTHLNCVECAKINSARKYEFGQCAKINGAKINHGKIGGARKKMGLRYLNITITFSNFEII